MHQLVKLVFLHIIDGSSYQFLFFFIISVRPPVHVELVLPVDIVRRLQTTTRPYMEEIDRVLANPAVERTVELGT